MNSEENPKLRVAGKGAALPDPRDAVRFQKETLASESARDIVSALNSAIASLGDRGDKVRRDHIEQLLPYASGESALPKDAKAREKIEGDIKQFMPHIADALARRYMAHLKAHPPDWGKIFNRYPELIGELRDYFTGKLNLKPAPREESDPHEDIRAILERIERAIKIDTQTEYLRKHNVPQDLWPYILGGREALSSGPFTVENEAKKAEILARLKEEEHRVRNLYSLPVPQGVSYRPLRSQPDDLPPIPANIELLLASNPDIAVRSRALFISSVSTLQFQKETTNAFVKLFLLLFEESGRAHIAASQIQMRTQLENAFWALAAYGIIKFEPRLLDAKRGGKGRESVGIRVNVREFALHVEAFLTLEKARRLEEELAGKVSQARKKEIEDELATLTDQRKSAQAFLDEVGKKLGIRRPRTIVEALGNRMYVNASTLPVFENPQPLDADPNAAPRNKSIAAALHDVLTARAEAALPRPHKIPHQLRERFERMHVALFQADDAIERVRNIVTMARDHDLQEPSTKLALFGSFSELYQARSNLASLRDEAAHTIQRATADNSQMRNEVFGPIVLRSEQALASADALLSDFMSMLGSSAPSASNLEKEAQGQEATASSNERGRLEELVQKVTKERQEASIEVSQHVQALKTLHDKLQVIGAALTKSGIQSDLPKLLSDLERYLQVSSKSPERT